MSNNFFINKINENVQKRKTLESGKKHQKQNKCYLNADKIKI